MRGRRFGSFIAALAVAALPATAFAATSDPVPSTITDSRSGTHDGFFYEFWKDYGDTTFTMWSQGHYTTSFSAPSGNALGGKGWNPGGPRVVRFSGTFTPSPISYLAVYGWTLNPRTEYYIVENHGSWVPPGTSATKLGTVATDGDVYDIYRETIYMPPSVAGTGNAGAAQVTPYVFGITSFQRYWSVRRSVRTSGVVTASNHFEAWAKYGFTVGSHDYLMVSTETYHGTVSSDITVSLAACEDASPSPETGIVSPSNICVGATTSPTATSPTTSPTATSPTKTPRTRTPKVITSTTATRCRTSKKGVVTCKVITKKTRVPAAGR